jgi:hypothetical protein
MTLALRANCKVQLTISKKRIPYYSWSVDAKHLYICPVKKCCQAWKLGKALDSKISMTFSEESKGFQCRNVQGLPKETIGLQESTKKQEYSTSDSPHLMDPKKEIRPFPVKFGVVYQSDDKFRATRMTLHANGTGWVESGLTTDRSQPSPNLLWSLQKENKLVFKSAKSKICSQTWETIALPDGKVRLHQIVPSLSKTGIVKKCQRASGLLPGNEMLLEPIVNTNILATASKLMESSESQASKGSSIVQVGKPPELSKSLKTGKEIQIADLGPFPSTFNVVYNEPVSYAPIRMILQDNHQATLEYSKGPGVKRTWKIDNAAELALSAPELPTCQHSWTVFYVNENYFELNREVGIENQGNCKAMDGIIPTGWAMLVRASPGNP